MNKYETYQRLLNYVVHKKWMELIQTPEFKKFIIDEFTSFKHFRCPKIREDTELWKSYFKNKQSFRGTSNLP